MALLFTFGSVMAQQQPLKILSYNVLKGFQGDTANMTRYVTWVKARNPDIVFYQEMNGFTQKSLENFAQRYGHNYAVLAKETGYSVALTSRFPIINVQKVLDNMWHGYLYANIQGVSVMAVHLSPFVYQKRLSEVKQILAQASLLSKKAPVIIAGDFNSFQAQDSTSYSEKGLLSQIKREKSNREIRTLNNGQYDYSVTGEMEKAGFRDAINIVSPKFNFSMPTKKYDAPYKSKIRIDYIWLSPSLAKKVAKAGILYDTETDVMSDHYPAWAQLKD